jgi:hypothetical protein
MAYHLADVLLPAVTAVWWNSVVEPHLQAALRSIAAPLKQEAYLPKFTVAWAGTCE